MTALPEHSIIISPIGSYEPEFLKEIAESIKQIYGLHTEVTAILKNINFAMNKDRNQYHSTLILEKLAERVSSHTSKVLAITDVDLFIPILTYVYGEAQLGGISCIISTFRLNMETQHAASNRVISSRIVKEAIHELGHTFKLRHCPEKTCIMHYCRSINDVDRKSEQMCRHCRILLKDELKRRGAKVPK